MSTGPVPTDNVRCNDRVIPLRDSPAPDGAGRRGHPLESLWRLVEKLVVNNSLQPSSRLRVAALRTFGADIGKRVIIRPRVRIRFPWNLRIGNDCWIGEGVWISNRNTVYVGSDVVISQETFITTGSHAATSDMRVVTAPVTIGDGTWLTTRCIVLGGVSTGQSSVITPGTVVASDVPAGVVFGHPAPQVLRRRFGETRSGPETCLGDAHKTSQ